MLFSKAIKIKAMVNRFNQERSRQGYPAIVFHCDMFALGKWSIYLTLDGKGVFFSDEVAQLTYLLAFGGLRLFVGSDSQSPVFHFQ